MSAPIHAETTHAAHRRSSTLTAAYANKIAEPSVSTVAATTVHGTPANTRKPNLVFHLIR
ncbi:hypothetical protein [Rhodococcus sp. 27YEA15]|uniref:hypothetical protein n=1 Tax=Rhodococcus sp. 27YEA15 TaxID=3156259 RepID=UPI003C7C90C4